MTEDVRFPQEDPRITAAMRRKGMIEPAWDMTTSKGKPGGQGTLFQVNNKDEALHPERRWPKGYNPKRQRQVEARLGATAVGGVYDDGVPEHNIPHAKARFVDVVARSTIPAEHLTGLRSIVYQKDPSDEGAENAQAYYMPGQKKLMWPAFEGEEHTDRNLIHEVGHHYSMTHEHGQKTSNIADTVAASQAGIEPTPGVGRLYRAGVEEARADNYYAQHYVERKRGAQPDPSRPGRYEENMDAATRDTLYPGYNGVRPPLQSHQFGLPGSRRAQDPLFRATGYGDPRRPRIKFSTEHDVIGLAPNPAYRGTQHT